MLIKTIHELRIYLPAHAYKEIETKAGVFDNSENDFLLPLLGAPLLKRLNAYYADLPDNAIVPRYIYADDEDVPTEAIDATLPFAELLKHAQRCIVYNAFERTADLDAVSVNNSGINVISADGYDAAGKDALRAYKDRLWKESHNAADRLLVFLEDLAKEVAGYVPDETPEPPLTERQKQAAEIVALWRESRYYYLADGLLINTATKMQEFVDIADNRERFVQMLPDMRFVQRNIIRAEVGAVLFNHLLAALRDDKLSALEQDIVYQMQELLALYTQQRSRVFKFDVTERKRIEEECIGLRRELLRAVAEWRKTYNDDGTEREPERPDCDGHHHHHDDCSDCCGVDGSRSMREGGYWGDKGNVFVMPGVI